ncbi:cell division protein SepF [Aestuariimicrobium sp. T2.26MG-19.2B]|uniref:cell division protein SepF n=1 Tax=Aestuariimicrobium sp. T2.26MG-19.2B TaxID=3040679 RepID=UPI0024776AB5|nr:Cell division protein SepF [Aestuariimicrobium sp. T2.26MG-19.2B]
MSFLRNTAEWLGLVQTDRYAGTHDDDDYAEITQAVDHRGAEDELSTITPIHRNPSTREVSVSGHESEQKIADLTRIITIHPRTYNEARTIGEHFRDGVPVIMNLSDMEDADAKRLVDFAAGLIFGLHGTIERVTSKVFLLSPKNVNVRAEDKERIASSGFFNQS